MNFKHSSRIFVNHLVRLIPKLMFRNVLKSIWQQPRLQDELQYHVQPYRFDSAIPTRQDVDLEKLLKRRQLPGIDFNSSVYLDWLRSIRPYAAELADVPAYESEGAAFWFKNGSYGDLDAVSLYAMIRHIKPRRFIEIGSGRSSQMIERACAANIAEGSPCDCTFIEPFPPSYFLKSPPLGNFIQKKVQEVPLSVFQKLCEGDILFIDTSHVLKTQGDCCYELLEIIPSLMAGVVIHVHDIFSPYDYPADWLFDRQFPFNEQYAIECILSGGDHFQVVLPTHLLWREHRDAVLELLPTATDAPGAFWFIKIRS
jgi:hypothetical protein